TYAYGHKRLWMQPLDDIGYGGNYNHTNKIAGQSATLKNPYDAEYPRMGLYGYPNNDNFSDLFLYDASYIRLNALNISYKLPVRYLHNTLIIDIKLTLQATNLFTITTYPGFDPQGNWTGTGVGSGMGIDSSVYPAARIFNFGVKITLK